MKTKANFSRIFIVATIGIVALSPLVINAQVSAKQHIYELLHDHRYIEAETAARSAKSTTPNDCAVNTLLGLALRGQGKSDKALQSFREAIKACPRNVPALEGAAEIAYVRNSPETKDLLLQILMIQPENSTAKGMLAASEARLGDCESAVRDYHSVRSQIAQNSAALKQLASCELSLEKTAEAVKTLSSLLALQDSSQHRVALARAQEADGKHDQALATLRPLLNSESKDDAALRLAAQIVEGQNETPQAVQWLRQAMAAAPKNAENYLYFAELSFNHGSYQVGVDLLNVGLQQLPDNARLLLARGVLQVQLTHFESAVADFQQAHKVDPKLSLADDAMGVLFSQKHELSSATALFEEKLKTQPNDSLVHYLYAEALSEGNTDDSNTVRAIMAAGRALELEPSYQPARDLLCVLLLRHGDLEGVVKVANEAIRRDPYDETALYQAVLAQRRLKHNDQVADLVQKLQVAKSHNQMALTKYVLQEPETASQPN